MKKDSLLSKSLMNSFTSFGYNLFRYALLIGVSYVAIFPIIKMLSASLTIAEDYYAGVAEYVPPRPTFINYKNVQDYFDFFECVKITLIITISCTVVSVFVCSLIGYGLGRYAFKGSNLVYAAVLFTIIMPIQTAQIPLTYYYRWFDFFSIGKLVGLVTGTDLTINLLPNLGRFLVPALFGVGLKAGIFIFLFRQFFAGMPKDLEEAAKLDGCSPFMIYLKVMIPNIIPVLVTVILLSVIYYWNDTLVTGMSQLKMGSTLMLEVEKLILLKEGRDEISEMTKQVEYYSIMMMSVLPMVIAYIFGQKFFVECMDRSGSKG